MGVANSLSRWHQRRIHTRVEVLESHGSGRVPDVVETDFDRVCFIVLSVMEALLEVRDSEDRLERSVYPARSSLVTQSERLHY